MATKLTRAKLERALRHLLQSGAVSVRLGALEDCAGRVDFYTFPYRITLDPFHAGLLESLVHELLHVAETKKLEAWGEFEETVAEGVENGMVQFIGASRQRCAWWRARIREVMDDAET